MPLWFKLLIEISDIIIFISKKLLSFFGAQIILMTINI